MLQWQIVEDLDADSPLLFIIIKNRSNQKHFRQVVRRQVDKAKKEKEEGKKKKKEKRERP